MIQPFALQRWLPLCRDCDPCVARVLVGVRGAPEKSWGAQRPPLAGASQVLTVVSLHPRAVPKKNESC
jgi:hypothetical protein